MPTVLRIDGFRFFFFSNEHEPEHVHIEKGDIYARVEIASLKVTDSSNASSKDIKKMVELVKQNKVTLQGVWNEYFTK
jgi:hypothetical protein